MIYSFYTVKKFAPDYRVFISDGWSIEIWTDDGNDYSWLIENIKIYENVLLTLMPF